MKETCIKKNESSSLINHCSGSHSDKAGVKVHTAKEGQRKKDRKWGQTGELTGDKSQDSSGDPEATAASSLADSFFIVSSYINILY